MKRKLILLFLLSVLFALILCVTGAARASAADATDNALDHNRLFVTALYAETGEFLDSVLNEIPAGTSAPTDAANFNNIPDGAYVKTFLLDAETYAPYASASDATDNFMDSGCESVKKLSPSEIVNLLESTAGMTPTEASELYDEAPSFTSPYNAGIVKEIYLQKATDRLNAFRAIAGLPAAVMDKNLNEQGQYGAVILGTENVAFSHYPAQPTGMSDEFYVKASAATKASNIYAGRDLILTPDGFMNDSDERNVDKLGHRRWQLNPSLGKVGFGYVAGAPNTYKQYTAEMCHDRSASNNDYDFIAWPPSGYCPNSIFGGTVAWSVTVNPARYGEINRDNFRVVLTEEASDTRISHEWTFSDNSENAPYKPAGAGLYYNIETLWYGVNNCIIFRPDGIEKYTGDWTVHIYGLKDSKGEDASLAYRVSFFDPSDMPEGEIAAAHGDNGRFLSSGTRMQDLSATEAVIAQFKPDLSDLSNTQDIYEILLPATPESP